ncbi:hypothetical protein [Micromonospora sp. WMMD1155]|uniref:hypothetical protein n=1 Tax=Micromonospora sp. WMMD1155 TaxID=3016094 RepID=UPI00249B5863|nr:hypothetical protein [Micromonospora sp. WMMD1155]WFE48828.1 hypothetical protein O7617_00170 [Micromonospora sp. WMMD1155]
MAERRTVLFLLALLTALLTPHPAPAAAAPSTTDKYWVVSGGSGGQRESLYQIAARALGNGSRSPEIFALNEGRLQPDGGRLTDPLVLKPGWILVLPADAKGTGVRTGPIPSAATPPPSGPAPTSPDPGAAPASPEERDPMLLFGAMALAIVLLIMLVIGLQGRRRRAVASAPVTAVPTAAVADAGPPPTENLVVPILSGKPDGAPRPASSSGPAVSAESPDTLTTTPASARAAGAEPPEGATAPTVGVTGRSGPPERLASGDWPAPGAEPPPHDPVGGGRRKRGQDRAIVTAHVFGVDVPSGTEPADKAEASDTVDPTDTAPPAGTSPSASVPTPAQETTPAQTSTMTTASTAATKATPAGKRTAAGTPKTAETPRPVEKPMSAEASEAAAPFSAARSSADDVATPGTGQADAGQPSTAQPSTAQPSTAQPSTAQSEGPLSQGPPMGGPPAGGLPPDGLTADLVVDGYRVAVSLVGVAGDGSGRPYDWRLVGQTGPAATLGVVLGDRDGQLLHVDLGRCPDVLTVTGALPDCERYALRLIRQLLDSGRGVAVVGDGVLGEALPDGCRRVPTMADTRSLQSAGIVVCGRLSGPGIAAARLSRASGGPTPVLIGEVTPSRWSVRVGLL